ncbi:hypothetical protein Ahia01_000626900, partial [Argonauta hians]
MDLRNYLPNFIVCLISLTCLGELNFVHSTVDGIDSPCPQSCWFNIGYLCYRIVEIPMPWDLADDSCKMLHSHLVTIDDYWTNHDISKAVLAKGFHQYWIGFNRIGINNSSKTAILGDGTSSSIQSGFWNNYQPNPENGDCVAMKNIGEDFKWSLAKCDTARVFVCEMTACSKDTYRCHNGRCIGPQWLCDGNDDCGDRSDEINCTSQCEHHVTGNSGVLSSENFPSDYNNASFCLWFIESDVGHYVTLNISEFQTESNVDILEIFVGGDNEPTSICLAKLSGTLPTNAQYSSFNNKMILKFTSDINNSEKGFSANWFAVSSGYSHTMLNAIDQEQIISVDNYTNLLHQTWTITTTDPSQIITLKKEELTLYDKDEVIVYDGDSVSSPVLGLYQLEYCDTIGPNIIMSTGRKMHILLKTRGFISNGKLKFSYYQGCNVIILDTLYGEIVSPGYHGNINYPHTLSCKWNIISRQSKPLSLKVTGNIDDDDILQVTNNGSIHRIKLPGTKTKELGATDGQLNITFTTNYIRNGKGFKLIYSVGCPPLDLTNYHVANSSVTVYNLGSQVNLRCVDGYVFRSTDFIGNQSIVLQCMSGGVWNIPKTPQCLRNYCGTVKYIDNAFVHNATGVMVGDTAWYVCKAGYKISGNNAVTCTINGTWDDLPTCLRNDCNNHSVIANGQAALQDVNGTDFGAIVKYKCEPGYQIVGNPISACYKTTSWSTTPPVCQKSNCYISNMSDQIPNANITSSQRYLPYNETLDISCNKGYTLVGMATIRCTENLTLTTLPACEDVDECKSNHLCQQDCINTPGGYRCQCSHGYSLQADGISCTDINECNTNNGNCHHFCENENGTYTCSCDTGYALYQANNTMDHAIPPEESGTEYGDTLYLNHSCVRVTCLNPSSIQNGFIRPQRKVSRYGDTFQYSCQIGYQLIGEKSSVCNSSGSWSNVQPKCEEMKCPLDSLDSYMNKPALMTNESVPYLGFLNFTCTIPGKGTEHRQRQCLYVVDNSSVQLLGDSYECGYIDCGPPMFISGTNLTTTNETIFGSKFKLVCSDLYTLSGNSSQGDALVRCGADGKWDYGDLRCMGIKCEDPFFPAGGEVKVNTYSEGGVATYSCIKNGYIPFPNTMRTCIKNNTQNHLVWSGEIPKCVDVQPPTLLSGPCNNNQTVVRYTILNLTDIEFSDNSGIVSVTVKPDNIGRYFTVSENFKVEYTASDNNGNNVSCTTDIYVEETPCSELQVPSVSHATKSCVTGQNTVNCKYECDQGYLFLDPNSTTSLNISCTRGTADPLIGKLNHTACAALNGATKFESTLMFTYEMETQNGNFTQACAEQYAKEVSGNLESVTVSGNIKIISITSDGDNSQTKCLNWFQKYSDDTDHILNNKLASITSSECGKANRVGKAKSIIQAYCPEGDIPFKTSPTNTYCVKCPVGSYLTKTNGILETKLCPKGEYKDTEGNQSCTPCPANTTTYSEGSFNVSFCKDICAIGSISSTGLPPCTLCPAGTFYKNETTCEPCPQNTKGRKYGSHSNESCNSPCSKGHYSPDGFQPCHRCPRGFYSNTTSQVLCTECPDKTTTLLTGAESLASCVSVETHVCRQNPCSNNGACVPTRHSYTCNCTKWFYGVSCDIPLDICSSQPCYNNGICTSMVDGFQCTCPNGTSGPRCEIILKTCTSGPCLNNGTCINKINSFECLCPAGFTGKLCNTNIMPCNLNPCQNGATCQNLGTERTKCICLPGFKGDNCEINIDDCASSPCLFNGTCVDLINGFQCNCPPGLSGKQCSVRENPCNASICQGNPCITKQDTLGAICSCQEEYTYAEVCQFSYESNTTRYGQNPYKAINNKTSGAACMAECLQDTQCSTITFNRSSKSCNLFKDSFNTTTSKHDCCETYTKYCHNPAEYYWTPWHSATASSTPAETLNILSNVGIEVCSGNKPSLTQCRFYESQTPYVWQQQMGVSFNINNICTVSNRTCGMTCPQYQLRFQCDINNQANTSLTQQQQQQQQCFNQTSCSSVTCYNGGVCQSDSCSCKKGYSGKFCQKLIDNCQPNPCEGGNCTNLAGDFECSCYPGYQGKNCTNINECDTATCNGTGTKTCKDLVDDFKCVCKEGYTGKNCDDIIDNCASMPCLHNGTCTNLHNDFTCNCSTGWTGKHCEKIVSYCKADTCFNGAPCNDLFGQYHCSCKFNTYGQQCESSLSLCKFANPCLNNASCVHKVPDVHCNCTEGFTGDGCEISVDSCLMTGCQNGGKCVCNGNGKNCKCGESSAVTSCGPKKECKFSNTEKNNCPLGFVGEKCDKAVSIDHDLWFYLPDKRSMATMDHPLKLTDADFAMSLWVKFHHKEGTGTFINAFILAHGKNGKEEKKILFRLHDAGMSYISSAGNTVFQKISHVNINDGQWHLVTLEISSVNFKVDLRVGNFQSASAPIKPIRSPFNQTLLLILGSYYDPVTDKAVIKGFQGYLSQLNIYNKSFNLDKGYSKLASSPKGVLDGKIYGWGNYNPVLGVRKIIPSNITQGQVSGSVPVSLTSCPPVVHNYGVTNNILLEWDKPKFADFTEIKENLRPGSLVPLGRYFVTYQAKDKYGNAEFCNFKVYAKGSNCTDPDSPYDGSHQCNYDSWPYYSCTMKCNSGRVPVTEYPYLYTCGPSGSWYPTDPSRPFRFPHCGESVSPTVDVTLLLSYNTKSTSCAPAKSAMQSKIEEALRNLSVEHNMICPTGNCVNTVWSSNCTDLPQATQALVFYAEIKNISESTNSTSTNLTAEEILRKAVFEDSKFDFPGFNPGSIVIANLSAVNSKKTCSPNQSFINGQCVICPPGTYFNTSDNSCDLCPVGTYQDQKWMTVCKQCPNKSTTITTGSLNITQCKDICDEGYYFNMASNNCTPCDTFSYQNKTGQFSCQSCPFQRMTNNIGSKFESDCRVTCPAGYELTTNCTPCEIGFYREQSSQVNTCKKCTVNTTLTVASTGPEQCNISACIAGQYLEESNNTCLLCPDGTYQDQPLQTSCKNCSAGYRTFIEGAQDVITCPAGYELTTNCTPCEIGFYRERSSQVNTCKKCTVNTTLTVASTGPEQCNISACIAGQYLEESNNTCLLCPEGTYQDQPLQTFCKNCSDGYRTDIEGAKDVSKCKFFCPSGSEANGIKCQICPQGSYKDNTEDYYGQCKACPPNYTTAVPEATSINNCTIFKCDAGSEPNATQDGCDLCRIGFYQPQPNQQSCIPCNASYSTSSSGSILGSSCEAYCESGYEKLASNSQECVACQVGYYKNNTDGYFLPCQKCPAGKITATNTSVSKSQCNVTFCSAGYFLENNVCIECPLNYYQNQSQQRSCIRCPANFKTWNNASSSCVRDCPPGEQHTGTGDCVKCPIASYRPANESLCLKCPNNFLTSDPGKTSVDDCNVPPCSEGTFYNGSICLKCRLDEYQDRKHQSSCKKCPAGKFTKLEGSKDVNSCISVCEAKRDNCSVNETCVDASSGHNCVCISGYVPSNGTCIQACDTTYCQNGGTCSGTVSQPYCICASYYRGKTCTQEIC